MNTITSMGPKSNTARIGPKQLIINKNEREEAEDAGCENATTVLNTPELKFISNDRLQRQGLEQKVLPQPNFHTMVLRQDYLDTASVSPELRPPAAAATSSENIAETINHNSPVKPAGSRSGCSRVPRQMQVKRANQFREEGLIEKSDEQYLEEFL